MANKHKQLEETFNLPSLTELDDDELDDLQDGDEDLDDYDEDGISYDDLQTKVTSMNKKLKEYEDIGSLSTEVTKRYNDDIDSLYNLAKNGYEEVFSAALTMEPAHGSKFLNGAAKLLEIAVKSKNSSIEKQLEMAKLQLEREKMIRTSPKKSIQDIEEPDSEGFDGVDGVEGENGGMVYDRNELIKSIQSRSKDEPSDGDDPA